MAARGGVTLMQQNPVWLFACSTLIQKLSQSSLIGVRNDLIMATGSLLIIQPKLNNVLCFPLFFRGPLDVRASKKLMMNEDSRRKLPFVSIAKEPGQLQFLKASNVDSLPLWAKDLYYS